MAASAPSSSERVIAQINITPLVDVMQVLLVIFMIAASVFSRPIPLKLPASTPIEIEPPPCEALRVTHASEYLLHERTMTGVALPEALGALAAQREDTMLEIAAAGDCDYQSFATALSAAQSSGLRHVTPQP